MQGPISSTDRVTLSYGKCNEIYTRISNQLIQITVSGLGFGVMSGAFALVNVLADSLGPGTVGLKGDSQYFFIVSAFTTLAFILLHTFWGIIFAQSIDRKDYLSLSYVIVSHLIASLVVSKPK